MKQAWIPFLAAALMACGGASTSAEEPSAAVADPGGAATEISGAEVYEEYCSLCHGDDGEGTRKSPALVGPGALSDFASRDDLLAYISEEMPKDDPGILSAAQNAAVTDWLLAQR